MQKIIILMPHAMRSGGPEACFQLCDALNRLGMQAELWPVRPQDLEQMVLARDQGFCLKNGSIDVMDNAVPIEEYQSYQVRYFVGRTQDDFLYVIPELYVLLLPMFAGMNCLVWWLSVDNALTSLSAINLDYLRAPTVRHAVQSAYARQVVESLGCTVLPLSDYTVIDSEKTMALTDRPRQVALVGGAKVLLDLSVLAQRLQEQASIATQIIVGMERAQVYAVLRSSRVLVDSGKFPGKDRLVREALALGCLVLTSDSGAAQGAADFGLDWVYRQSVHDLAGLAARIIHLVDFTEFHWVAQRDARTVVAEERQRFLHEVFAVFHGSL